MTSCSDCYLRSQVRQICPDNYQCAHLELKTQQPALWNRAKLYLNYLLLIAFPLVEDITPMCWSRNVKEALILICKLNKKKKKKMYPNPKNLPPVIMPVVLFFKCSDIKMSTSDLLLLPQSLLCCSRQWKFTFEELKEQWNCP